MRRLILMTGATLALAACGKSGSADNQAVADDNPTAANIVSNDVTAIDAVTGDAANMAADVDMNEGDLGNQGSDNSSVAPAQPSERAATKKPAAKKPEENATSTANTVTNTE